MKKVFIIAEAGVNHNGSFHTALKMIDAAKDAGVDAIKFQTFKTESIVTQNTPQANYQKEQTENEMSQFQMLKHLELSYEDQKKLMQYCQDQHICFLSAPFDHDSIDFLASLGLEIFKIPSGEITNLPYLRKVGSVAKKVILSTGMSTLDEVKDALKVLMAEGLSKPDITLLHCNTEYPTPDEDANLLSIKTLQSACGTPVGYSDHTKGVELAFAAVALGATVIEKHFTLDRTMPGPDHAASLEPSELKQLVEGVHRIEEAFGDGIKKPSKSESKNMAVIRKSIVSAQEIKKGEFFSNKNLTVKRPGTGINPMRWDELINTKSKRDYQKDELIES